MILTKFNHVTHESILMWRAEVDFLVINKPIEILFAETFFLFRSIGTIIGAIIGGIVGLIVLRVITAYVKNICCKKKISPETSIHPAEVSIVNSNSGLLFENIVRKSKTADKIQYNLKLLITRL